MELKKVHVPDEKETPLLIGGTKFYSCYDFSLQEQDLIKTQQELTEQEDRKAEHLKKLKRKLAGKMASNKVHISEEKKRPLLIGNRKFYFRYDFNLEESDLVKTQQELREQENRKTDYLKKLKGKLSEDKQLNFRTDDDYLLRYLRYQKFDCDKACRSIRKLYSLRKKYPEYFLLTPRLEFLLNSGFFKCLPYRMKGGPVIMMMDFRKLDFEEISFVEVMQLYTAVHDVITMNPHIQINGVIGIWDFRGLSFRLFRHVLHPSTLLMLSNLLQDTCPWKVKYILGIYCSKLTQILHSTARPLVKKKIYERVHALGSGMGELHKFVDPVLLPKEYGGTFEETDCRLTDIVLDNLPYLEYERSFGYSST